MGNGSIFLKPRLAILLKISMFHSAKKLCQPLTRIVSLVPSQTELLFDLGLENAIIGITKFCVHPLNGRQNKTIIGGTKDVRISTIKSLQPDLIIANKEENVKDQVQLLSEEFPVFVTDVYNLTSALKMINSIAQITNTETKAAELIKSIRSDFENLPNYPKIKAAYLIWRAPYMTVGGDTFINDMMSYSGFENVFSGKTRYPEITIEEIKLMDCQVLMLSTEPYPFKQKHIAELQIQLPGIKIMLVDGEMFSWYGTRLLYATNYFKSLRAILGL